MDNNKTRIFQYLKDLMTLSEREAFEKDLSSKPDLKKEFDFELLLFQGINEIEKSKIQKDLQQVLKEVDLEDSPLIVDVPVESKAPTFHLPSFYPKPSEGFGRWLARSFGNFKAGISFGISPAFTLASALLLVGWIEMDWLWLNAYSIQLLVIGLTTIWLYFICPAPNYYLEANRASLGLSQFWNWWRLIWVMWFFLYLFLSLRNSNLIAENFYFLSATSDVHFFNILIHLANNLASLAIFVCYDIIQKDTFRSKKKTEDPSFQNGSSIKVVLPEIKDVFFDAEEIIGSNINKSKYYILLLIFTAVELSFFFSGYYGGDAQKIFGLLSGMIGGVAFGMLFSKLNSKYLGLNEFFFILLITYIVIQPGFNFLTLSFGFENAALENILMNVFSYLALALKLILLAIIQWLVYSNQLLYYLAVSTHLNKEVEQHRIHAINSISRAKPVRYKDLWKVRKL